MTIDNGGKVSPKTSIEAGSATQQVVEKNEKQEKMSKPSEPKESTETSKGWSCSRVIAVFLLLGGLSFLLAIGAQKLLEFDPWVTGVIFATPLTALLVSLLRKHRDCGNVSSPMRAARCIIAVALVIMFLLMGVLGHWVCYAETILPRQTIFMLDKSGSMNYPGYDHSLSELQVAIENMGRDESVGLVLFNHNPLYVKEMAPVLNENHVQNMIEAIHVIPPDGGTDFDFAFSVAADLIRTNDRWVWTQIILLTDGMTYSSEVNADALESLNVTVHGVALNDYDNLAGLQAIISETGGKVVGIQDLHQLTAPIVTVRDVRPQCAALLGLTVLGIGLGVWLMKSVTGQCDTSKAEPAKKKAVTPQERNASDDKQ